MKIILSIGMEDSLVSNMTSTTQYDRCPLPERLRVGLAIMINVRQQLKYLEVYMIASSDFDWLFDESPLRMCKASL